MVSNPEVSPIDAVITWVDGGDPVHAAKLDTYLASIGRKRTGSAGNTRFHNAGEIDYCVTSILKFAPWIRTIFIVTDEQQPTLMAKIQGADWEHRIKIVDHKAIFNGYEEYLPTFNSSSILTMLWRIPELAEKFIFFNDDFVLIRPIKPQDFYSADSVVVRGHWHWMSEHLLYKRCFSALLTLFGIKRDKSNRRPGHRARQEMAARLIGFQKKYFRLPHVPHAWKRSTFEHFFAQQPNLLLSNIAPKLRSDSQFVVEALACHLELQAGRAIIDKADRNVQLKPGQQFYWRIKSKLRNAEINPQKLFLCMQSIEAASQEKQQLIFDWLDRHIGSLDVLIKKKE